MSYELLITEKPSAARRIAYAIAEGSVKEEKQAGITNYHIKRKGKEILVAPAVGHLFGLAHEDKKWTYPVFDVEWQPTWKINKKALFSKKYYANMKKSASKASGFIVGTDLDIEGETIARNILLFLCKVENAKRMKFSTLTKDELIDSYDKMSKSIDTGLANAGVTRHTLDFFFGINVSRALTLAVRSANMYKVLSSGRVQGPALAILAQREKEIRAFKPKPFWQIELLTDRFTALHKEGKFWEKEKADKVIETCKGSDAIVEELKIKRYNHLPPVPFNLTDLQSEAYKLFGYAPRMTQQLAHNLYINALISYPRTSSQKLPPQIGFKKILAGLSNQGLYIKTADEVLKTKLVPRQGKKTDEAHPAIYPTGEPPKKMNQYEKKVYDLIVRRFFAVFGEAAIRETSQATLDVNGEKFKASGTKTVKEGWFKWYAPYVRLEEVEFPSLKRGDVVEVKKLEMLSKETKPPARYNPSSMVRELEKRELGTKSTRADVLNSLYERGYISEKKIEVTELGMTVINVLNKYIPGIISEKLTRKLEDEMKDIRNGKVNREKVVDDARTDLTKILGRFKEHETEIGKELSAALKGTLDEERTLGVCLKCGGKLKIMQSRKGNQFVGCGGYPECRNIYPLPGYGKVQKTGKTCETCKTPIVKIIRTGKRPWNLCLDPKCETKKNWGKKKK